MAVKGPMEEEGDNTGCFIPSISIPPGHYEAISRGTTYANL